MKSKWLLIVLALLIVGLIAVIVMSCLHGTEDKTKRSDDDITGDDAADDDGADDDVTDDDTTDDDAADDDVADDDVDDDDTAL